MVGGAMAATGESGDLFAPTPVDGGAKLGAIATIVGALLIFAAMVISYFTS